MGLDMYLEARVRSYRTYEGEEKSPAREAMEILADALGLQASDNIDNIELIREAAYWRKSNAIHGWFVREVQGGTDDCDKYDVSREQLGDLRSLCAELLVKRDPEEAMAKLPPVSGFFFGSTDIDEWFWSDLEMTVKMIDRVLGYPEGAEFFYHSSW